MKTPVYRFLFIDRNDDDMEDSIYMKSVVTTLVKNLHNKLIDEAYKVLGVDPIAVARDSETSIRLDYCSSANLIGQVNYSSSVVKNYYFSTEMEHENRLVFDMANIEAECARKLIKQKILVDDNDLSFYRFKFSKKTESLRYLNQLKEKFKNIRLSESVKSELTRLSEEEKKSMKDFILEVAEPVLLGYYYDSPYMKLSNILSITKIARPLRMRIEDFVVMDLPAVYDFVLDSDFSSSFNTPLKTDQRDALGGVDFERLQRLESDMKESLEAYPDQQEMMKSYGVELQGIEVDDLPEALRSITFGQLGSLQKEIESRSLRSLRGRQEKMRKNTGGEMDSENM
jgi:hypothetical protein